MNDTSLSTAQYVPPNDPITFGEVAFTLTTAVAFALAASCGARAIECGVVDLEVTRTLVADEYPDVLDVYDRMDFFCKEDTNTFQTCARSGHSRTEGCTVWPGAGPYRGRTYLDLGDEEFTPLVLHEAQHWHLERNDPENEGCPSHDEACGWSEP